MQNTSLRKFVSIDTDQWSIYAPPEDFRYVLLQDNIVNVRMDDSYGTAPDAMIPQYPSFVYTAKNAADALCFYNYVKREVNTIGFVDLACNDTYKIFIRKTDIIGLTRSQRRPDGYDQVMHNCVTILTNVFHAGNNYIPAHYQKTLVYLRYAPLDQDISNDFKRLVSEYIRLPYESNTNIKAMVKTNKETISKSKSTLWNDWEMIGKNKEQKCDGDKTKYVNKSTNVVTNYQIKIL